MADDKRNGDDLFEDLDKFFAPIKDVEWDEPASAGSREEPGEEHVSVRPDEPASPDPPVDPSSAAWATAAAHNPGPPGHDDEDAEDDEAWYDTSVLETIEEIGPIEDSPEEETVVELADESGDEVETVEVETAEVEPTEVEPVEDVRIVDSQGSEAQADLFGDEDASGDEPEAEVWSLPEDEAEQPSESSEPPEPGPEAEVGRIEEDVSTGAASEPSGDLLADLGADEVEEDILSDLQEEEVPHTVMVGSGEGLGGPSWQEPAAVEVGGDIDRRGPDLGERDVPAAFLTGIVLAGVALGALLIGRPVFAVIAAAVILLAQGELFGVLRVHHKEPATLVGLITGGLMMLAAYRDGEAAVVAMFALGVVATFLWFMGVPAAHRKDTSGNIGLTIANMAWIPLLASYLLVTLQRPDGTSLVVAVIGLTFVYDTAAFLSGSVWGGQFFQRPLAPSVSPKKSVEGLIIAGLVTVVVSVTMVTSFVDVFEEKRIEALLLGLVVAAAATFGDLAESLVKRDIGIKDMGSVLPGHGGVLDRIDSLLFVAPATFLLFRIIFA